jgi:vacuolar-type H+-ATPase subunit C/Vma6
MLKDVHGIRRATGALVTAKIWTDLDFLIGRVRAIHSRAYEGRRLADLLNLRTPADLAQDLLPGEPASDLQRRLLEKYVGLILLIWRHLQPPQDRLFQVQGLRLELENLKFLLRVRLLEGRAPPGQPPLVPLPAEFQWPGLHESPLGGVKDVVAAIDDPRMRYAVGEAVKGFEATGSPLVLEARLDQAWFALLGRAFAGLDAADRNALRRLLHFEANAYNLLFLLRGRVNHQVEPEQLARLVAPLGGSAGWTRQAAQGEDVREIVGHAPAEMQRLLANVPPEIPAVERRLREGWAEAARAAYHYSFNIAVPYGFVVLKRIELANLTVVAEGLRYGLGADEVNSKLFHVEQLERG